MNWTFFFQNRASAVAPADPSDNALAQGSPADSQLDQSWTLNSNGDATLVRVQLALDSGFTTGLQDVELGATATEHEWTNLPESTEHFSRVRAEGPGGESDWSATASATTAAAPPDIPDAPTSNAANAVSSSQINQSWTNNDPTNTDNLRAQIATDSNFTNIVGDDATLAGDADSKSWTGLDPETTHYTRVRAENASGESMWSSTASDTTDPAAPGAPSGFSAASISSSRIDFSWNAASGSPDGYHLFRDGSLFKTLGNVTSHSETTLPEGDCWNWKVRAFNDGGPGGFSTERAQGTKPNTPGLSGCNSGSPEFPIYRLDITDNSSVTANIRIYRNGALHDTVGPGNQSYVPSPQTGSFHVTATGPACTTPDPTESANSPTVTTPFEDAC